MNNTHLRLSVNLNEESANILRASMKANGRSATETIRRAIGLLGFFEAARARGDEVSMRAANGDRYMIQFPY